MTTSPRRADLPQIEVDSQQFWSTLRDDGVFLLSHCQSCDHLFHYPRPMCPRCWSDRIDSRPAAGTGTLYTYSVVYMNDLPPFADDLPYAAAVVALDEGPHVMTRIVGTPLDQLEPGQRVELVPTPLTDDITIALFTVSAR
jgi:hypothetical protein